MRTCAYLAQPMLWSSRPPTLPYAVHWSNLQAAFFKLSRLCEDSASVSFTIVQGSAFTVRRLTAILRQCKKESELKTMKALTHHSCLQHHDLYTDGQRGSASQQHTQGSISRWSNTLKQQPVPSVTWAMFIGRCSCLCACQPIGLWTLQQQHIVMLCSNCFTNDHLWNFISV